jgi:hypothetical protein
MRVIAVIAETPSGAKERAAIGTRLNASALRHLDSALQTVFAARLSWSGSRKHHGDRILIGVHSRDHAGSRCRQNRRCVRANRLDLNRRRGRRLRNEEALTASGAVHFLARQMRRGLQRFPAARAAVMNGSVLLDLHGPNLWCTHDGRLIPSRGTFHRRGGTTFNRAGADGTRDLLSEFAFRHSELVTARWADHVHEHGRALRHRRRSLFGVPVW